MTDARLKTPEDPRRIKREECIVETVLGIIGGATVIEDGIERQIGPHDIHGVLHFDSGDARVTSELAAFAGIALKMIQDASGLRASEERLNLALRQRRC